MTFYAGSLRVFHDLEEPATVCPEIRKALFPSPLCRVSGLTIEIFLPTIFLPLLGIADNGARIWWARIFWRSTSWLFTYVRPPRARHVGEADWLAKTSRPPFPPPFPLAASGGQRERRGERGVLCAVVLADESHSFT
jgi:hypothetical protein